MYTVVLQAASATGNEQLVHLRRAASASAAEVAEGPVISKFAEEGSRSVVSYTSNSKAYAPSLRGLVMEYYGPGQRLREIYLASREGERVAVPITLAVQISPRLREFVDLLMTETGAARRQQDEDGAAGDEFAWRTMNVPCCADVLHTAVDFVTAKLELDLKLSEEGVRLSEDQKKEHWRDYLYSRIAWRMDLDDFADDILRVADHLSLRSLHDLMGCCFRLRL